MKYAVAALMLLLSGCFNNVDSTIEQNNRNIKQLQRNNEENRRMLRVLDCHLGITIAIENFHDQLYKKVTKEQFDAAWNACAEIGKGH